MDIVQAEQLFVQRMHSKNWSVSTIQNYASQVKIFLQHFKFKDRARNITATEIEHYLLDKVCINTRKHTRCSIQAFYKLVINQPMKLALIPWPKKEVKLIEYITHDEALALINVCKNIKHKSIIVLLYGMGLRVSEVINLKPEHIKSKQEHKVIQIIQAKGKKDRQVQLPDSVLKLLREYYTIYTPKSGYLFDGQFHGEKYSQRSINLFLKKYAKQASIQRNIHAHLLRHGFATTSLENGIDIHIIQKILGHNDIKTTLRYTHVSSALISNTPSPLSNFNL